MRVKYFGQIAESIGKSNEVWLNKGITVGKFKSELMVKYPQLNAETLQIAINLELVSDLVVIGEKDEVAVLPQFSGG